MTSKPEKPKPPNGRTLVTRVVTVNGTDMPLTLMSRLWPDIDDICRRREITLNELVQEVASSLAMRGHEVTSNSIAQLLYNYSVAYYMELSKKLQDSLLLSAVAADSPDDRAPGEVSAIFRQALAGLREGAAPPPKKGNGASE